MINISPLWSNLFQYLLPAAGLIPCPSLIYLSGQVPDLNTSLPPANPHRKELVGALTWGV